MFILRYLALVLAISLLSAGCKKSQEKTQPVTEKISESVYASGVIKSKNQYQVYATVGGLIQKIAVKEGDLVKKGDPLFIVENETARLNAENARLATDFANANLGGERLRELKGAIDLSKSKMLNDSLLLLRQRDLWAQNIGSKVELEQRELAYSSALTNYQAAISRYNDLQKQLGFAAAQSQKQLAISRNINQDYVIRSQIDGRVYSISKEAGETVNVQSPVAIIGASDDFVCELQIDENDIARVRIGQRVFLSLDSYKGQVFEAVVAGIDPIMNERSRTFKIEAGFTERPPVLYPNLTTEANIVIRTKENALTIPRSYMINDSMVMLAGKEKRIVQTGLKDYKKVEILSGLTAGDYILKPGK